MAALQWDANELEARLKSPYPLIFPLPIRPNDCKQPVYPPNRPFFVPFSTAKLSPEGDNLLGEYRNVLPTPKTRLDFDYRALVIVKQRAPRQSVRRGASFYA